MKINVISKDNGVGLTTDYTILRENLPGHDFHFINLEGKKEPRKADLNIYLELVDARYFGLSPVNVLMPNPEWFNRPWIRDLHRFDYVWAKTRDCERIFSDLHSNVVYTGFTSPDCYMPEIKNRTLSFLHLAGRSETKGTGEVLAAFSGTKMPIVVTTRKRWRYTPSTNIYYYQSTFTEPEYRKLQNSAVFNVCPSQYEGFGHYIHEARSCGIVLTTDAPPMNEFITDPRLLVRVAGWKWQNFGQLAIVDVKDLRMKCEALLKLQPDEIQRMFWASRNAFLSEKEQFKERINNIINEIHPQRKRD